MKVRQVLGFIAIALLLLFNSLLVEGTIPFPF